MSILSPLIAGLAAGVYIYSFYVLTQFSNNHSNDVSSRPGHNKYGLLRFLTNQTLLIQVISCLLHVVAPISLTVRKLSDLFFTALAFPLAAFVSVSFWAVFAIDRELIFPKSLDAFFPNWLNHSIHSLVLVVGLLLILTEHHKYYKFGLLLTVAHLASYLVLLYRIKAATNYFVYPFLDAINELQLYAYYVSCFLTIVAIYYTGYYLNSFFHPQAPALKQKSFGNDSKSKKSSVGKQH